jgi:hypothetical protein
LGEIVLAHKGRPIQLEESVDIKNCHIELLRKHAEANPELFQPITGTVSIVTGAWLESAVLKLEHAGFTGMRFQYPQVLTARHVKESCKLPKLGQNLKEVFPNS